MSKFRHIYGDPYKTESQFLEIQKPLTSGEGTYVVANSTFFAVARSSGGGPVYIRRHDNPGRFAPNAPLLSVHSGKCWDMDFHPFIENMIATAADDTKVAVTQFPIEGLKETITEPTVIMGGHGKKVTLCTFNPSANSILATGSFDRSVKVWNIETQSCVSTFDQFKDNVYSLEWNLNGSMLAATGKDKQLRTFDPRNCEEASSIEAFDGGKSSKVFWVPRFNWVGATGFSKTAKRQLKLWDCRNMGKPVFSHNLDQASSILMPHFDNDTGVLFLAGKGEGSISYFEIQNNDRKLQTLSIYRVPKPQKGGGWVPKKGLDVWKCEVQRFMKLTQKAVEPISFIVPRKAGKDVFQEDIFPDCFAGQPALGASEWESGENKDCVLMSMDPANRNNSENGGNQITFEQKKSYAELEEENQQLRNRIKELESQLNITSETNEEEATEETNEEATEEEPEEEENKEDE